MLWPALLLAILYFSPHVTSALRFVAAIVIAVTCWRVVLALNGATADRLYNGTDTHADALLIGAVLSFALAIPSFAGRLRLIAQYFWPAAVAIIAAVPAVFSWDDRRMFLGGFTVVGLAAATLLTAALSGGIPARVLGHPLFVWIGRRSYGLYLWHYPIMLAGLLYFHIPQGYRLALIEVACAFGLATLSYKFVERPFLERRYANSYPKSTAPAQQISK